MPLVNSTIDNDDLTNQWISNYLILACNGLIRVPLDEVTAQNLDIPARFDKDAIALDEFAIPQKQIISIIVSNGANCAFILPWNHFDHLVDRQTIANLVTSLNNGARPHSRYFFADLSSFDIDYFELVVDDLQVILVHL